MSLYLGTAKISGVATGEAAVTIVENKIGSEVIVGEITLSAVGNSITMPDIIGKDNVSLMYMSSCNCPSNQMADAGFVNILVQGESFYYVTHYYDEFYSDGNDRFVIYDKTTGRISVNTGMSYNEKFIAGKYRYVAW